jgi:c(7)-type cytochrome triheme protein
MGLRCDFYEVSLYSLVIVLLCGFAPAPPKPTIEFNHSKHLAFGLECSTCHAEDPLSQDPQLPKMEACGMCHEVVSASSGSLSCNLCHTDPEFRTVWTKDAEKKKWDNIAKKFKHKTHIQKGMACTVCHENILNSTKSEDNNYPKRDSCGRCHVVYADHGYSWSLCTQCHDF